MRKRGEGRKRYPVLSCEKVLQIYLKKKIIIFVNRFYTRYGNISNIFTNAVLIAKNLIS